MQLRQLAKLAPFINWTDHFDNAMFVPPFADITSTACLAGRLGRTTRTPRGMSSR